MGWQEIAVVVIVAGAVAFLLRRLGVLGGRRRRGTGTFIPLSSLKKPDRPSADARKDDAGGCH